MSRATRYSRGVSRDPKRYRTDEDLQRLMDAARGFSHWNVNAVEATYVLADAIMERGWIKLGSSLLAWAKLGRSLGYMGGVHQKWPYSLKLYRMIYKRHASTKWDAGRAKRNKFALLVRIGRGRDQVWRVAESQIGDTSDGNAYFVEVGMGFSSWGYLVFAQGDADALEAVAEKHPDQVGEEVYPDDEDALENDEADGAEFNFLHPTSGKMMRYSDQLGLDRVAEYQTARRFDDRTAVLKDGRIVEFLS